MEAIEFGKYLKKMRNNLGITLKDLGEKTGLSKSYLSHIENGRRGIPSPDLLRKIGDIFNQTHGDPYTNSYGDLMLLAGYWDSHMEVPAAVEKLIEEEMIKEKDVYQFLQKKDINYKSHLITENDKKLITFYLDTLFENRKKED